MLKHVLTFAGAQELNKDQKKLLEEAILTQKVFGN